MLTDADLVRLCAAIYLPQPSGFWDQFWDGGAASDGICAGIKNNAVIFRGSVTIGDWYRDTLARGFLPLQHSQLGLVDYGFYKGMDEFFEEASKFLSPGAAIGGHSLGAARAWLFAGRYIAEGNSPSRIAVFGSPRPGCQALGQILAPHSKVSYKNRFDPVTEVPIWTSEFESIEPTSFTMLDIKPAFDDFDILADHHIEHYIAGVESLIQ